MVRRNRKRKSSNNDPRGFNKFRGSDPPPGFSRPMGEGSSSQTMPNPPRTNQQQQASGSSSRNVEASAVLPSYEAFMANIRQNASRMQQNVDMSRVMSLGHPVFGIVDGEIRDAYLLTAWACNSDTQVRGLAIKPGRIPPNVSNLNIPSVDLKVGELLYGVVDGDDHKAHLVTLRSSDCDTLMSGIFFKPGHYLPVTSENNAALGIPFVHKTWSPF